MTISAQTAHTGLAPAVAAYRTGGFATISTSGKPTACPETVHTSPAGPEEYWAQMSRRRPASKVCSATPMTRRLFDWYHLRLVITVTPTVVTTRPPLVEPGWSSAPRPARADRSPYAEAARRLPSYRSAVLGAVRGQELPSLLRVDLAADPDGRRFQVLTLVGEPLTAGPVLSPDRFIPGSDGMNLSALRALRQMSGRPTTTWRRANSPDPRSTGASSRS